ncbi:hypothetical protein [Aeromonas sanarellii]
MCRNSIVTILRLTLCWPLMVGTVVAADISVTSTFVSEEPDPTCDATAGPGLGGFSTPDRQRRNWSESDNYCTSQGMRMPTSDEWKALADNYIASGGLISTCNWPSDYPYWTATEFNDGHYAVLGNGNISTVYGDDYSLYVTCVR